MKSRRFWIVWAILTCSAVLSGQNADNTGVQQDFLRRLVSAAIERTNHSVRYDPAYVRIPYPGGDVPVGTGVCSDEIIRAYRAAGVDLQKDVHEDMEQNFSAYPRKWRWILAQPDSNIDHRRVPNLMVFFRRKGESLPITNPCDGLQPWRSSHVRSGPQRAPHWDRGESQGR